MIKSNKILLEKKLGNNIFLFTFSTHPLISQFFQEYCAKNHLTIPMYQTTNISGKDHNQKFTVECVAVDCKGTGTSSTIKIAKRKAAQRVVEMLKNPAKRILKRLNVSPNRHLGKVGRS